MGIWRKNKGNAGQTKTKANGYKIKKMAEKTRQIEEQLKDKQRIATTLEQLNGDFKQNQNGKGRKRIMCSE